MDSESACPPTSDSANKNPFENQTILNTENQKLQENVYKLSKQLEELRKGAVNPIVHENLVKEKNHLFALNESLKQRIHSIKTSDPGESEEDIERQRNEKQEIIKSIEELDVILRKINDRPEPFEISTSQGGSIKELCETLTRRLEEEQARSEKAMETIRRLRDNDEKLILKEKMADMKQVITDLEVENTKLKYESEQLVDDLQRYKCLADDLSNEIGRIKKEKYAIEDEKEELKQKISDLENEKLALKKDMIEELTEANRAKRISADTEIALQHISEAYENKRQEVSKIQRQLEEANIIIASFKEQFNESYDSS